MCIYIFTNISRTKNMCIIYIYVHIYVYIYIHILYARGSRLAERRQIIMGEIDSKQHVTVGKL